MNISQNPLFDQHLAPQIFINLRLSDLMKAKQVCKQWKQLIDGTNLMIIAFRNYVYNVDYSNRPLKKERMEKWEIDSENLEKINQEKKTNVRVLVLQFSCQALNLNDPISLYLKCQKFVIHYLSLYETPNQAAGLLLVEKQAYVMKPFDEKVNYQELFDLLNQLKNNKQKAIKKIKSIIPGTKDYKARKAKLSIDEVQKRILKQAELITIARGKSYPLLDYFTDNVKFD